MIFPYPMSPDDLPDIGRIDLLGDLAKDFKAHLLEIPHEYHKSLYWTIRLSKVAHDMELWKGIQGYQETAIGLFDPDTEGVGFGIILIGSVGGDSSGHLAYHRDLIVPVDDHHFPVRIRRIQREEHIGVPNPDGGTGACYGVSRESATDSIGPGIVTAKHVVGSNIGEEIDLSCLCPGKIIDIAPDGIDCALVKSDCAHTRQLLAPLKLVPPWMPAYMDGARTGYSETQVTAVTNTMGVFSSSHLPIRIYLADSGLGGDSGALVVNPDVDRPIGIYMGAYNNPAGQSGGFAQHIYQAAEIMDMRLYS